MDRRKFLGASGAVVVSAAVLSLPSISEGGTSPPLSLSVRSDDLRIAWLAYQATCFLDGVDITRQAFAASTEGWADCFEYAPDGHVLVVNGEPVEVRRYGHVRFEFTPEADAKMREWGWA